jgi:hypothetical protein
MEPAKFLATFKADSHKETRLQGGLWLGMAVRGVGESGIGIPPVSSTSDWHTYSDHAYYLCAEDAAGPWPTLTLEAGLAFAAHLTHVVGDGIGDGIILQLFGTPPQVIVDDPLRPLSTRSALRLSEHSVPIPNDVLRAVVRGSRVPEWISTVLSPRGDLYVIADRDV